MLTTLAFAGCQEPDPSRTIISMQLDSNGETTWIYLYTVPRVKMGNFTIIFNEDSETLTSVFSHQKSISRDMFLAMSDSEGYLNLSVAADLKEVYWHYSCKIKITSESDEDLFFAEVHFIEEDEEKQEIWELPYNVPLDYEL